MSAAGVSYLVAKELDSANIDLAKLAIIGNVGDMMAREKCGLVGPARDIIVEDGVRHGSVEVRKKDLNCYGTATRPLHLSLAYNDDPFIKGISNNPEGARQFLKRLGIRQQTLTGAGMSGKRSRSRGQADDHLRACRAADCERREGRPAPCRDLRVPGRNSPDTPAECTGICDPAQCLRAVVEAADRRRHPPGRPGTAYRDAEHMLNNHRAIIRNLLQFIIDTGVKELENLQWLHVGGRYPDTIVGIGAGMALSKLNSNKPILIMCEVPEDTEPHQGLDADQRAGRGTGHRPPAGAQRCLRRIWRRGRRA